MEKAIERNGTLKIQETKEFFCKLGSTYRKGTNPENTIKATVE